MTPVRQTRFGFPHGNCMAACVASLLDMSIDEMPVISADADFNEAWDGWLLKRGLARICFSSDGANFIPRGYYLAAGPSPRAQVVDESGARAFHVVVARDGKMVHDPHPEDTFLEKITEVEIIYALDPAKGIVL